MAIKNYFIFLLFLSVSCLANSQTQPYAGEYSLSHATNDSTPLIEYTLSLKPNGTFLFHSYRKINDEAPEEHWYGKGKWAVEKKNQLFFYINKETDLDEKYTLNFSKTKARYVSVSPRDISGSSIKTSLIFYSSEIFWVKGMKLFKKE